MASFWEGCRPTITWKAAQSSAVSERMASGILSCIQNYDSKKNHFHHPGILDYNRTFLFALFFLNIVVVVVVISPGFQDCFVLLLLLWLVL